MSDDKPKSEIPLVWDILEKECAALASISDVESYVLFCGARGSGKTTLVDRFIRPDKSDDVPKPTYTLDYKYAKYTPEYEGKRGGLAHIYDTSGLDPEPFAPIPIAEFPDGPGSGIIVAVVDVSSPQITFPGFTKLLAALDSIVMKMFNFNCAKRGRAKLVIVGGKWDLFTAGYPDAESHRIVGNCLRFIASSFNADLVVTSTKDRTSLNSFRQLMRSLLPSFSSSPIKVPSQLDTTKPIVCTAKDNIDTFGSVAPPGLAHSLASWLGALRSLPPAKATGVAPPTVEEPYTGPTEEELRLYADPYIDKLIEAKKIEYKILEEKMLRSMESENIDPGDYFGNQN